MAKAYSGVVHLLSRSGDTVIALDATESVEWSRSVTVSNSTVFSGATISDNIHSELPIIAFSGIVSFSKIRDTFPTPDKFLILVNELIDSKETMTLYGTDDGAIPSLNQCYITNISANRTPDKANALSINVSVKQIDISTSIKATEITIPATNTDGQLANREDTGVGTKTEVPKETIDGYVLTQRAIKVGVR